MHTPYTYTRPPPSTGGGTLHDDTGGLSHALLLSLPLTYKPPYPYLPLHCTHTQLSTERLRTYPLQHLQVQVDPNTSENIPAC